MNLEYFIAKRVQSSAAYKNSVSAPIIKIAIAAIAIGIIVILIAVATGVGLQRKIKQKVSIFNGQIGISYFDRNQSVTTVRPVNIDQDFYPYFDQVPEVNHIQGVATKGAMIRTEKDFEGIIFKGVGTDYDWTGFTSFLIDGRIPEITKDKRNKEILISDDIARRLDLGVGDKAATYFMRQNKDTPLLKAFVITGIYDSGLSEYDEKFIIGDIQQIQKINKWEDDQVGRFELFIEDFDQLDEVTYLVQKNTPYQLNAQSIKQQFPHMFQWLDLLDSNIYGITGIILLVGIINMITALLVLILDRTFMIGLLKALGMQQQNIRTIFLYNAMFLIGKGIIIGNLVGLSLIAIQYYYAPIRLDPQNYYVTEAPVYISFSHVLYINILVFVVTLISLILPTFLVSKISPVKALRFD